MNPVLEEWSLYFEIKHGLENREQILKAVWELISNPERHEMVIPDGFSCRAGGIIHGSEKFDDGAMIMTSPIKKLVKGSTIISSDGDIYTTVIISSSDKKISAVTEKGHVYVLYYVDRSRYFQQMLDDAKNGVLSNIYGFYNPELNDPRFL